MQSKIRKLISELDSEFIERQDITRGLAIAALVGEHAFLLGPPGTGKSKLSRAFCQRIGGQWYEWLLTRFTTPEELFGPVDLASMKTGSHRRITKGKVPEADVAFLDEAWKGSSAILNALLSVTNERIYHNNGAPQKCPLRTCLTASNELPDQDDDSLKALYDRIMFRFVVGPLSDPGLVWLINRPRGKRSVPAVVITIAELETAQDEIEAVTLPAGLGETFADIRSKLRQENIEPSGRRLDNAVKLLQASAWLDNRTQVEAEDLEVLIHVLWDEPSQIPAVKRIVLQAADPNWQKALELFEAAEKVAAEAFNAADGGDKITIGAEAGSKVKIAIEELGKLGKSARIAELVVKTQELQKNIIRRCFGMTA